jgi:hypothetical protein
MSNRNTLSLSLLAAALAVAPAMAADPIKVCQKITGTMSETILPQESAPNDPFGRILGAFTGSFGGAANASVTAFLVTPPGFSSGPLATTNVIQVRHAFLTGPGDVVTTLGKTIFNVAPATLPGETAYNASKCPNTPCVVENPQVLTITGGTGRWAGASGELRNLGLGNINLPQGQGWFTFVVAGEVCVPSSSLSASGRSNPEF